MRSQLVLVLVTIATLGAAPRRAAAQRWQDATAECLGTTAEWSSKVEVADLDGDGHVDILLPNGGGYSTAGAPEPTRIFRNLGTWSTPGAKCTEISAQAVLGFTGLARAIKVADVDGDGDLDILTGGAWQTQLRLFTRTGATWTDATANLPQQLTSAGDFEFGDVDRDGDLDLVIAEWGAGAPQSSTGGRTRLYLNDGTGSFTDATAANMPDLLVRWSWELTLADLDGDWDLDILVASKSSPRSFAFKNDGLGRFTDDPTALPAFTNNYALEPMDIDRDGDLDLVTINDGPQGREHLFINAGDGRFTDETAARLAGTANPSADDNAAAWLDVDSDGDPDLLIGSLDSPDRLLLNDGAGVFTLAAGASTPSDTPGTLGIAVVDLNGDGRLDLVQGQGETDFDDKVQLGSVMILADTAGPVVRSERLDTAGGVLHARAHDHQSPFRLHDLQRVVVRYHTGGTEHELPMTWYGEALWVATLPAHDDYAVCAIDRRGTETCDLGCTTCGTDDTGGRDDVIDPNTGGDGGCCEAGSSASGSLVLALGVVVLGWRRRKTRTR
ncbi:MAG: VCBS repeat-containing protein [Deltaproteobacteria bacterium]|nr:VCBS repeat-containing protein [Deltaproteobacteria bacterium]